MKKIAFLSNGCQGGLCKPREIIAADPENYREVRDPKLADILMVNFCAISAESIDGFRAFCREVVDYRKVNPDLKIIAGGCVEGLAEKRDLSFADAIFHHQGEAEVLAAFLKKDHPTLSPAIMNGAALINIAQGCNRRCSFCKVHFLDYMQLTSRSMDEILDLAQQALVRGITTIVLSAENSTEYGLDIGTDLQTLIGRLLELDDLRILDVYGICLDEVMPSLLETLKHPKIRALQVEIQSLNDQIRKNMNLRKNTDEALAILDALSGKFLISNFMYGFPGHSIAEFNREMRLVRAHHLYYLSLDEYDDTPAAPSHKLYQPPSRDEQEYYQDAFLRTVAKERQLLLKQLMRKPYIEASVVSVDEEEVLLYASHYTIEVYADYSPNRRCRRGDIIHVKVTGLHDDTPLQCRLRMQMMSERGDSRGKQMLENMRYFDIASQEQFMPVSGKIVD